MKAEEEIANLLTKVRSRMETIDTSRWRLARMMEWYQAKDQIKLVERRLRT